MLNFEEQLHFIIKNAFLEDLGEGDPSTLSCIPKQAKGKAKLLVKDTGMLAGVAFAEKVFHYVDTHLKMKILLKDGSFVKKGDVVFEVFGNSHAILKAERIVLNGMQRMSAIATKTNIFASQIKNTKTKLLDTRKTTPCIRLLEKWAVQIGGGENHRFGLYDMIMLKDNHIDFAGSIFRAIEKTKQYLKNQKKDLKIIVEARNLKDVSEILQCQGVHRILLDHFNFEDTKKAVQRIGNFCQTESSGNIDEKTIKKYAMCGVDFISCGAITNAVANMDLSLKAF